MDLGLTWQPTGGRSRLLLGENAQRLAQQRAKQAGLDTEGRAVADEPYVPIAETTVSVANEREAQAIVVGARGHGRISEIVLGSTSRDVIRRADRPVMVVRHANA